MNIDINEIVQSVLNVKEEHLKRNSVMVTTELSSKLPETMADFGQLQQLLLNLMINAEEAILRNGGKGTGAAFIGPCPEGMAVGTAAVGCQRCGANGEVKVGANRRVGILDDVQAGARWDWGHFHRAAGADIAPNEWSVLTNLIGSGSVASQQFTVVVANVPIVDHANGCTAGAGQVGGGETPVVG